MITALALALHYLSIAFTEGFPLSKIDIITVSFETMVTESINLSLLYDAISKMSFIDFINRLLRQTLLFSSKVPL